MYVKGVSSTTLDEVRAASGTSKSQLYNHFADKEQLVRAVVRLRAEEIMERERAALQRLRSFNGLVRWRDALVQRNALQKGAYGCLLGSIAAEVSDQDEVARMAVAETFVEWENLLEAGLRRMQDAGTLTADADPRKLAIGLMAALQGDTYWPRPLMTSHQWRLHWIWRSIMSGCFSRPDKCSVHLAECERT